MKNKASVKNKMLYKVQKKIEKGDLNSVAMCVSKLTKLTKKMRSNQLSPIASFTRNQIFTREYHNLTHFIKNVA